METLLLVVGGLLFVGAIVYAVVGLVSKPKDELEERLGRYAEGTRVAEETVAPAQQATIWAERLDRELEKRGFAENIRTQLARANLKITVTEFMIGTGIAVIVLPGLFYLLRRSLVVLPIGIVLGFFGPRWYVSYLQGKRLRDFNNQLADTINLMVNSIRAGYSILQAMEAVAREMGPPISEEFARVVREVQLGLSTEQALSNLVRRVPSDDLDLMITAINVQREVGGNLAEVLEAINFTIRERVRIKGEIRALTAQGRYSGYLISFMPVALSLFIYLVNPSFIKTLFEDPCGWIMIGFAVAGIFFGFLIIRKIVDIEV